MAADAIWVCPACGANYPPGDAPPPKCPICVDERQWVPPDGQRWATMGQLARDGHRTEVRLVEPGLIGVAVQPPVGVGQRGLLVLRPEGNVLWDPPPFIDDAAVAAVREAGGVRFLSSSHPHMYGAIVEWSHIFGAEILLAEVDAGWLARPDDAVRTWSGRHEVVAGVTLVQCGGHFPGSSVLHWADGAGGRGVLLCGDTLFVTPGEDRISFVYSAPNRLPLSEPAIRAIVSALSGDAFDRIYGGWWTPVLRRDAKPVLERCAERYIQLLRGEVGAS